MDRALRPGPLATSPKWKALGRHVRKGEKALVLCQPVTIKRTREQESDSEGTDVYTRFVYRPACFVLAQTEGADLPPASIPSWSMDRALTALDAAEVPFDATDGNLQGFARGRSITSAPLNPLPFKTAFHELAHVLLGHTSGKASRMTAN